MARALGKSSGPTPAAAVHEEILALPSGIVDDQGFPIRLYGASQLVKQAGHEEAVAAALREIVAAPRWLPPPACYLLRDLSVAIADVAPDLRVAVEKSLLEVEQVLALREDVWGYETLPNTRTVDNHVATLKAKLEPDTSGARHIQTVHGVGYNFVP